MKCLPLCSSSDETEKAPVGREVWIFVTNLGQLTEFLPLWSCHTSLDAEAAAD
jgi:hypothetical protein